MVVIVAMAAAITARSANLTWSGAASMNWNSADSNWGGPLWNNATPDSASFGATGVGTVNLTTAITANTITFNTAGYTLTNNTLTLGGTFASVTNNADATIASVIAGTAGLTKLGVSRLTLTASNTFTGNVVLGDTAGGVNGGIIRITTSGALGNGSKTVYLRNGSTTLELDGTGGNLSLASGLGFVTSGTPLRNLAGTNVINGAIQMNTGAGNSTIISDVGKLTLAGGINSGSSSRTLVLAGTSFADNSVSGVIVNGVQSNSVNKIGVGTWRLMANNTYSGSTIINAGKLFGVAGGSCSNSAVTVSATLGNTATFGVAITNITKQWTCASLGFTNAGNGVELNFNFGVLMPSFSVAPLRVIGLVDFTNSPVVSITTDTNIGPVGAQFPLMTWGSLSGTPPTNVIFNTSNLTGGHLVVSNSTLYLVIDNYTPTLSDSQLFSALNLDYLGLETVKAFVLSNDFANAKTSLATYLRTRTNVNWNYDWHHPTNAVSYDQASANAVTNGIFSYGGYTTNFPNGNIDWNYQPSPTSQWLSLINRMDFWPNLGATYWGTGDEGYARAWVKQLRSWITQEPMPATYDSNILDPWAGIDVGARMKSGWPDSFFRFVLSPSISDDDLVVYLKSCVDHGRCLTNWAFNENQNVNIYAWEMSGLYTVGTVFPELKEAAGWRAYAAQETFSQETNLFYPDGAQTELSPRYHIGTLDSILNVYNIAGLNNQTGELPAGFLAKLEKPFEFLLYNSAPTRLMPPFNDCGSANESAADWLATGYGYFTNRPDFLWISGGGQPPARTSWNFPYAGYAAMRSSWDTTANYLCFQAGPLGSSSHRHDDGLNVVLWAYGRELLFDSGGGSYESTIWRTWGTSSYSHNCVVVDGLDHQGWSSATNVPTWWQSNNPDFVSANPVNIRWESDVYHDFAAQIYNRGYNNNYNDRRATDTRRVLFVKPDIYVVADTLVPTNTATHTYEARWHLRTTNAVYFPATKVVVTADSGVPNLAVVPCLGTGLTVTKISGQTSYAGPGTTNLSEILGWDQPDLNLPDITPATTVLHKLSGTSTQQFLTVFLPLKPGATNPVVSVANTGPTSTEITLTDGRKLRVYADPNPTNGIKFTEILPNSMTNRYVGAGFTPPVIAGLTNLAAALGATVGPLPFTVTDNSPISNVVVSVHSLNQSLVPEASLTLTGAGTNRTLSLALVPNQFGVATIAVTALDSDGATMSASFDVTVSPSANTAPSAPTGNTNTAKNVVLDFNLWQLSSDAETVSSNLLFTVGTPTNGTVTLLADGHTARFTPANNFTGTARFTYTVADLGEDARTLFHYGFEPPDDPATGSVADWANLFRPGEVLTVGTGSVQMVNDTPTVLGRFDTQSIRLTENGDNDGAQVRRLISPYDFNVNNQDWTFACWFKRATSTNDDFIFHLGTGNGFGADEELQLWCPSGQSRVGLFHWNGVTTDMGFYSASTVANAQWNHVAVTFTRTAPNVGTVALYLNGALVNTAVSIPFNFDQSYPLVLGGHPQTTTAVSRWFNGNLDEAVFLKGALSGSEITRLATNAVLRFGGLKATNIVAILVGATAPQISALNLNNGQWQLSVSGNTGFNYTVAASTNLVNWISLFTTNPPVMPFLWTDAQTTNFPRRFYRVLLEP